MKGFYFSSFDPSMTVTVEISKTFIAVIKRGFNTEYLAHTTKTFDLNTSIKLRLKSNVHKAPRSTYRVFDFFS